MVALPAPFSSIPRQRLLFDHPPPIEKLGRLSAHLCQGSATATFWIKREDCNSGIAFGGNKIRKLEYVIADALENHCDTLVTTGGIQSNHMRQVAGVARKFGLSVTLAPRDVVFPNRAAEYEYLGNVQITSLLSATRLATGKSLEEAADEVKSLGGRPYIIPSGASKHPLGGLGYARWAFEVIEQEKVMNVYFDTIIVAAASGSTLAGMVAGFALAGQEGEASNDDAGRSRKLIGIDAHATQAGESEALILQIARATANTIGFHGEISADSFVLDRRYNAGKYGHLDTVTVEGIKLLAELEGIVLDPVYSGKAFTGLVEMVKKGELHGARNVLFVHTGGQVSLPAYPSLS